MGIEAIDPFELPLINTVYRVIILCADNVAVLVKTQLCELNLTLNYNYIDLPSLLSLPLLITVSSRVDLSKSKRLKKLVAKYYLNSAFLDKFYRWFAGFSDAEGSFTISPILNRKTNKIEVFSFKFTIGLHKDDLGVLNIIQSKLRMGKIYSYTDKYIFVVTKMEDIKNLISIFSKYKLNTSKYLDFSDFNLAFTLYQKREKLTDELISKLLELKNNMNTKRINFNMPENHVLITKSWLLGFIEGDGSFSIERATFKPLLSIRLSKTQLPLLVKIKEFLENNLGFDSYSMYKIKNTSILSIISEKARDKGKSIPLAALMIKNTHVLNNYLIPFLSEEKFMTKKGEDFLDFKIICKTIYNGAHSIEEIAALVLKLSYTMNNYRLSTFQGTVNYLSKDEMDRLMNAKPTIEHLKDGRQIDLITKKVVRSRSSSCIYEIIKPSGEVLLMPNLAESALMLDTSFKTLKRHLEVLDNNSDGSKIVFKDYTVRRIPVFYPIASE
uniref:LAGLIDADG endonuclease n=1 Tax=Bipolaris cookei TaxID=74410 RepID=A0A2H4NRM9_9PLEO|nr:LAGLIDADG endonuclease [Bipolaris cookei]ATV95677.1 LAGLIDADG endonuclease [Bipolaris cookei]